MPDNDEYDMEAEVEAAKADGWSVQNRDEYQVTLRKRTVGSLKIHLVIAVLTIWWAYGVVNLLYFLYAYFWNVDRRVLTTEGEATEGTVGEQSPTTSEARSTESGSRESLGTSPSPASDPTVANEDAEPSTDNTQKSEIPEQSELATRPDEETVELIPFAEARYEMVYGLAGRVSSIPGFRLVMKLTVVWYRFAVMRCLGLIQRVRPASTLVRRYQVDTVNIYEHFFAGYRNEDQPEIVRTMDGSGTTR